MRRIFVHAGQPKTGTSAIQMFCAENREALLRLGYLYPAAGMVASGNHARLVQRILGLPAPPEHENAAEDLLKEIDLHSDCTAIVSAEYLFSHFCSRRGQESKFLSFLRNNGLKVTLIMYVRPEAEQINSVYAQQVKTFLTDATLAQHIGRHVDRTPLMYQNLVSLTKTPRGEVRFFPYHDELKKTGVTRHLLATIGLSQEDIATFGPERRVNETVGPIAIAAARDTLARIRENGQEPSQRQRTMLQRSLAELIAGERAEPTYQGIDEALYEEIESAVAQDRELFAQAVWRRKWEDMFPPALRAPCNTFHRPTAEPSALEQYRRMMDALWAKAKIIMADQRLAKINPWDRSELRRLDTARDEL